MRKFLEEVVGLIPELFKKEESWLIVFLLAIGGLFSISFFQISLTPQDVPGILWSFFKATWWFWIFPPLLWLFQAILLFWRQEEYKEELEFVMLEIRLPREIEKGPKSMEQILLIMSSLRNVPTMAKAKYYEGEVTVTFSLELVSIGGQVHFYLRVLKKQQGIIESAFFSYYPDVELLEVPDYTLRFPQSPEEMYRTGIKIWGTEMMLARDPLYPIKTYMAFETGGDEKRLDPISSFLEVLGKVKPHETVAIQILATPADPKWGLDWHDELNKLRDELSGGGGQNADGSMVMASPKPQKMEILKAIEANITKPAFESVIRFIYIAPEDNFSEGFARGGIVSSFNQYADINLNAFRQNFGVGTNTGIWYPPYLFSDVRVEYRRQRMLINFLKREMPPEEWMGRVLTSHPMNFNFASESFLINVEGLATIFHLPPAIVLTAPHIERLESRKAGPSAGLSIFGKEEDLERFY
jgi:hypothetical protein